jgi:flagellar protein FliJ
MPYRFTLETLLRVRRVEEDQARRALVTANAALRAAIARRDRADGRYRAFSAVERAVPSVEELLCERLEAGFLAEQVTTAQREALASAGQAAIAQAHWSKAAKRVAVLERLEARRRAEHVAEELRLEVALVDDLVTARYVNEQFDPPTGGRSHGAADRTRGQAGADRRAVPSLAGTRGSP